MAQRRCHEHRPSQSGFGGDFGAVGGHNSFLATRSFWLVAGPRRLAYSTPHVDSPDLHRRVVKLRCGEAEAAMDVVGVRRKGSQFRSWVLLQFPALWRYFHAKFERWASDVLSSINGGAYLCDTWSQRHPVAGPCTADIAQFEAAIRQSAGNPFAGLTARQSVNAQLNRQPTPESLDQANERLKSQFSATMARAKRYDAQGNRSG
jgi:hypothetical protein